ncbi:hypothetical protein NI456_01600 [Brevundimonas diminuta]|uniref:hypothetical protein n=1 Tax=Brevundimonas diminuta TaxID=293 RepID=UPI002097E02C|nr:hypothetical protein [Brevundimonas diminuta]MCO8017544.1 hypothetical protein [Brevundimonas diminuta]MCO8021064.1 hypothetical protein [Brevundimonas diminuta]
MSGVKHTPWEVVPANTHHGFYVTDVAGRTVCDLYFIDRSDIDAVVRQFDGAEANARLIAAAPDLLEVAQQILDRGYVSESIPEERADHLALRAAIARARGEQSPNHSDQKEVGND